MSKPTSYVTSFQLDKPTATALETLAKNTGMNKSAIMRCLISQAVEDGKFDFKNPLLTA